MKITEKENYIVVEDDKNDVLGFSNYLENHAYDEIKAKKRSGRYFKIWRIIVGRITFFFAII